MIEGVPGTNIHSKEAACIGHMVYCPKCGNTYPIIEGAQGMPMFGRPCAVEGMKTACGAELIASQDSFVLDVPTEGQLTIDDLLAIDPVLVASLGNGYLPGGKKSVSWRIIDTDKVIVMVNDNGNFLGTHAGLMIGVSGHKDSLIYDPGGSYDPCRGKKNCKTEQKIGSDRVVYGNDTDFSHYIKFQIDDDGADVHVFTFDVAVKDIDEIKFRIQSQGGGSGGECATMVSGAITGISPFCKIWAARPKELKRIMFNLKKEGKCT